MSPKLTSLGKNLDAILLAQIKLPHQRFGAFGSSPVIAETHRWLPVSAVLLPVHEMQIYIFPQYSSSRKARKGFNCPLTVFAIRSPNHPVMTYFFPSVVQARHRSRIIWVTSLAADGLAPSITRSSAAIVLNMSDKQIRNHHAVNAFVLFHCPDKTQDQNYLGHYPGCWCPGS